MDNSCGAFSTCSRCDVRVFQAAVDVTDQFFPCTEPETVVFCDETVLFDLMARIKAESK